MQAPEALDGAKGYTTKLSIIAVDRNPKFNTVY